MLLLPLLFLRRVYLGRKENSLEIESQRSIGVELLEANCGEVDGELDG
jgi:hypothetical protein